jgi:hypothetical protein
MFWVFTRHLATLNFFDLPNDDLRHKTGLSYRKGEISMSERKEAIHGALLSGIITRYPR